ncbi:hypothetical protein CMI37_15490 [Candidatus Pacearchaeota archaeon]|nr:hypothetical protein [Candidatus Pacearchaeota archaeon]
MSGESYIDTSPQDNSQLYDPKAQTAFADPIVRCDSCQALVRRGTIHKLGCCDKCGNRRMRNVLIIKENEMQICKDWDLDADFLALFEETDEIKPTNPIKCPRSAEDPNVA